MSDSLPSVYYARLQFVSSILISFLFAWQGLLTLTNFSSTPCVLLLLSLLFTIMMNDTGAALFVCVCLSIRGDFHFERLVDISES